MALTNLFGLAASLARPVCRGYLTGPVADAGLICATLRAERAGALGPRRAGEIVRLLRHTLRTRVAAEQVRRDLATWRIRRALRPMIAAHRPWGQLMAEAHEVNAGDGAPLSEPEVGAVVEREVWFALPAGGRRHG